jgi:SpoIID/LytB domain protein
MQIIHKFVGDQLSNWPLACENFRALKNVDIRTMEIGGLEVKIQHNPARIISSAAKTDSASLKQRKCFLCAENRPAEQIFIPFEGRKGKKYEILVNPYPIFPDHLVIALASHQDQAIWNRYVDILDLAKKHPDFTFFYNGPKCGASAPDHHHFQATNRGLMPLEADVDRSLDEMSAKEGNAREIAEDTVFDYMTAVQDAKLYHYRKFVNGIFVIRAKTAKSSAKMFYRLLDCLPNIEGDTEPRFNLFTYYKKGEYRTIVVLRTSHRSHHYFSEGPDHLTMSPGCADMAGFLIASVKEDYEKLTPELLTELLTEVTLSKEQETEVVWKLSRKQPKLSVGIMSAQEIEFEIIADGAGKQKAIFQDGRISYNGALYDELYFEQETLSTMFAEPSFILYGVKIGVDFHWERTETQKFAGALKIIVENNRLTAVNIVGVEDYLLSVISSEMKSSASEDFLKAHAVISRSWVLSQIQGLSPSHQDVPSHQVLCDSERDYEYVKWYDHDDHTNFDVCADDHCQRYQGLTRVVGDTVRRVIDATWGEVLMHEDKICDARFSKCCGGMMERFSTCWADEDYAYLQVKPDNLAGRKDFCDTQDEKILTQVLNDYDLETKDFYRWETRYSNDGLSALILKKSGHDLGRILSMEALERGGSGRISKLKIVGEKKTLTVGKELEIRKILSESHLKSSAFDVDFDGEDVILRGRGWGHGVGLCQIGAAVMSSEGYDYRSILLHYYPESEIRRFGIEIYK